MDYCVSNEADRHYDRLGREDDALIEAQIDAEREFMALCHAGDAAAAAGFAPETYIWAENDRRTPKVHELLFAALECTDGPSTADVMQALLDAANGKADSQAKAQALVKRMARTWALVNVEQPQMEAA